MEIGDLPEECISLIISLTSPRDACRLSLVSRMFKSVSESDVVWDKLLPSDYKDFTSQSLEIPPPILNSMPKKRLYFHLCDRPVIIANGNMSFSLDKPSGKKCFMVGAKTLSIVWGDVSQYWKWKSFRESRFSQVVKLKQVWWLHVIANVETRILSSETTYAAYLVFRLSKRSHTFDSKPVQLHVHVAGQNGEVLNAFLDPASASVPPLPRGRGDGWMEIEMGEFFNEQGEDGLVWCNLREFSCSTSWCGLIVEGVEFRPKAGI